ncbi:hypothetical protein [Yinghuangia sp. YIM S10712]|uniref:hypothetical protein n=1 Tax=Yinghuangia sp. YIM S10712 TaxID=3436930 RepID=UPI003F52BA5D
MLLRFLRRRLAPVSVLVAMLVLVAVIQPATADSEPFEPATVSVDFGDRQGALLHTERFNNFHHINHFPEQRRADVDFLNEQGLRSDVQRVWLRGDICDSVAGTCEFQRMDPYLSEADDLAESLMIVMTGAPYDGPGNPAWLIREGKDPSEIKRLVKLAIGGLKQRHPKIEYVEAFNEPDWALHGEDVRAGHEPALQPEDLYAYYVPFYEAVNELNAELRPEVPLKVGGPAFAYFKERWFKAFLDDYAADPNPRKRLDFISWHGYGDFNDDYTRFHFFKEDPSEVGTQRAQVDAWLHERCISTRIPAFITETGLYPGPAYDDPDPGTTDYVRQAAGMAALHYWWSNQPNTYPFHWVLRHGSNGRKDQLVTRTPDGPVVDTFTPYGNMLLMQSKMKTTKVEAVSDSLEAGQGVYAVAAKDRTGASLMVWNYQHVNERRYQATIDMSNLPPNLRHGPVRQRMFRIDQTTSNYFADPAKADLQQVDEKIVDPGKTYTETIDLEPNAIYLILLEPV